MVACVGPAQRDTRCNGEARGNPALRLRKAAHPVHGHGGEQARVVGVHVVEADAINRLVVVLLRATGSAIGEQASVVSCLGLAAAKRTCTVFLCTYSPLSSESSGLAGQRGMCVQSKSATRLSACASRRAPARLLTRQAAVLRYQTLPVLRAAPVGRQRAGRRR